jgi:hypothetical protein
MQRCKGLSHPSVCSPTLYPEPLPHATPHTHPNVHDCTHHLLLQVLYAGPATPDHRPGSALLPHPPPPRQPPAATLLPWGHGHRWLRCGRYGSWWCSRRSLRRWPRVLRLADFRNTTYLLSPCYVSVCTPEDVARADALLTLLTGPTTADGVVVGPSPGAGNSAGTNAGAGAGTSAAAPATASPDTGSGGGGAAAPPVASSAPAASERVRPRVLHATGIASGAGAVGASHATAAPSRPPKTSTTEPEVRACLHPRVTHRLSAYGALPSPPHTHLQPMRVIVD